ncbi:hypothetical protein BsWGS_01253 [Bradybaena similaris]
MNSSNSNQCRKKKAQILNKSFNFKENASMAEGIDRSGNNNADTDTDALGEGLIERNLQQETAIKTGQMTWNLSEKTGDNGIIDYMPVLPAELKYSDEILILNAATDIKEAENLKEEIENNVTFCGSLKLKPNVTLLKDVIPIKEGGDALDEAFKRTLFVFLYITEDFCKHSSHLFDGHSCLNRALNSVHDQRSIIPVHTSPINERKYYLPVKLDGLRPLNYFSKTFYQDVERLLDHKSDVILKRRVILAEMREQYIKVSHKELCKLRAVSPGTQNVIVPTPKMKVNPPDIPIKASVLNSELQNRICAETQDENQVTDFTCRSSQQKTKNTAASQQTNTEALSYLWLSKDNFSSVTTDSPSNKEIYEESSGKDKHSQQMGLQHWLDYSKSCDSTLVKTVKYNSFPEPADVDTVLEDLTPNAFSPTESNVSHNGSHNLPTGHSLSKVSDFLSKEGSHPSFNYGLQSFPSNTAPINTVTFSRASPGSSVHDVPRSSSSMRLSENVPTISGSQVHIHIRQATNVAFGEHGQINVLSRSEDADDSEDLGSGNSFSKINAVPLHSRSEDTEDSTSRQHQKNTTNQAIHMPNQERQLQNMTNRATGERGPNREARQPTEGGPNREAIQPTEGGPNEEARRPTGGPNRTTRQPTEQEQNKTARRPTEEEPNRTARQRTKRRKRKCVIC